jgi:hypothetical protein
MHLESDLGASPALGLAAVGGVGVALAVLAPASHPRPG